MITVRISFKKMNELLHLPAGYAAGDAAGAQAQRPAGVAYAGLQSPHLYDFCLPALAGAGEPVRVRGCQDRGRKPRFCPVEDGAERHHACRNRGLPRGAGEDEADAIAYACYCIRYPVDAAEKLAQYNTLDSVPVEKKSKRGVRMVEMKEYVPTLELETEGESVSFAVCLPASQDLNLNPSLLTAALEQIRRPGGKRLYPAHRISDGR